MDVVQASGQDQSGVLKKKPVGKTGRDGNHHKSANYLHTKITSKGYIKSRLYRLFVLVPATVKSEKLGGARFPVVEGAGTVHLLALFEMRHQVLPELPDSNQVPDKFS